MRRYIPISVIALLLVLIPVDIEVYHHRSLPQLDPVEQVRIPFEVQSYLQVFVVDEKIDLQSPVGAGVCVERKRLPLFDIGYCHTLSVSHVCVHVALGAHHEGGDFHPFLDLCMMVALHDFEGEANTVDLNPERYGTVYNYSAPLGAFEAGDHWMLPMFTRRLFGYVGSLKEHAITSVPVHQGSSGSAIYQNGALIGIVTQRNLAFEHYSYAVRSEYVAQYLSALGVRFHVRTGPDRIAGPPTDRTGKVSETGK